MFALVKFLRKRQLVVEDFTLSNLATIAHLGKRYVDEANPVAPNIDDWKDICPFIDVWLDVREDELSALVRGGERATASELQRKLGIGYLTADEICECMIDYDVVDPETRKFIPEKQPQQVGS